MCRLGARQTRIPYRSVGEHSRVEDVRVAAARDQSRQHRYRAAQFRRIIRASINTNLGRKGYQQVETEPDLYVTYDVTPYEKTKSNPFSVGVGMGSWGGNVGGGVGVGTGGGSRTVQESRITITVVDRKTDKEVWQGTMTGSISPGASSNDIGGVVAQAMSDFPPRRP